MQDFENSINSKSLCLYSQCYLDIPSSEPPSAPVGPLEVKEVTSTTATISWKPPQSDGGLPVKRYTIERRDAKRQAWMKVRYDHTN